MHSHERPPTRLYALRSTWLLSAERVDLTKGLRLPGRGPLSTGAVLASLYPASTVVLARTLLKESVSRRQALGVAAALVSITLIAG